MSGHSKWAKIKRQKGANDARKGMLFTRLARDIAMAASEGGGDPDMNFTLRLAIEKGKEANMPKDNIERAVKKGAGGAGEGKLARISYEAYAKDGSALIVDCTTDNTNRTVTEVKRILEGRGAKFAQQGSVKWQFEEKGLIVVVPKKFKTSEKFNKEPELIDIDKESLSLDLMGIEGVEDVSEESSEGIDLIEVLTSKSNFKKVHEAIVDLGVKIESAELIKTAKDKVDLGVEDKAQVVELIEALEENDDVDSVWSNVS